MDVRHAMARWPLWELPRWLQLQVTGLITAYAAAITAAAVLTPIRAADLRVWGVLLACAVISVELTRRPGEPSGIIRDVYAIWELPIALLLPPLYVLLSAGIRQVLTQVRVRRTVTHRRAYTAAATGLAYAAASLVFHAAEPALGGSAGAGTGLRALAWTLLAAGCGIMRLAFNDGLIVTAVRGVNPQTAVKAELIGAEATVGNTAELCLGLLVTYAAAHSVGIVLFGIPLVVWQQRSWRHKQLEGKTRIDKKTGLLNDETWRAEAADEVARANRTLTPIAVAIMDIDHFKQVNDTFGHLAGDTVLAAVATATRSLVREYDVVGRIGGEEFAVLLPHTPVRQAIEVAERVRQSIPQIAIPPAPDATPGSPGPDGITVSIGVAAAEQASWNLTEFLARADAAMYAAKGGGRNRVFVVATGDDDETDDPQPLPSSTAIAPGSNGNGTRPGTT